MKDLLDLAAMRELAAGCGWRLDELVERYLREAHTELGKLKKTISLPDAQRVAHGLKGASATAGVVGMTEVMRRIEDNDQPSEIEALVRRAGEQLERVEAALQKAVATDSTGA
jgi:HPt (histidine-containing phosphotransfer) domain-containing protein